MVTNVNNSYHCHPLIRTWRYMHDTGNDEVFRGNDSVLPLQLNTMSSYCHVRNAWALPWLWKLQLAWLCHGRKWRIPFKERFLVWSCNRGGQTAFLVKGPWDPIQQANRKIGLLLGYWNSYPRISPSATGLVSSCSMFSDRKYKDYVYGKC